MPNWKHKVDIKRHFIQDRDPTSQETTATAKLLREELARVIEESDDENLKYELETIRDELEMIGPEDSDEDAMDNFNYWMEELYHIGDYKHRVWVG